MKTNNLSIRQIKIYAAIAIILSFFLIVVMPTAFAFDYIDFIEGWLDTINNGVFQEASTIFGGNYFNIIINSTGAGSINAIKTTIAGLAGGLVVVYALMHLVKSMYKGGDMMELLLKALAEVFIGIAVITYLNDILTALDGLGKGIFDLVTGTATESTLEITAEDVLGTDDPGFFVFLKGVFILFLPYICAEAAKVIAKIISFSILIELGIRKAFAPFACASIVGEGFRSPGVRYLKKYFATWLKQSIIVVVCVVVGQVESAVLETVTIGGGSVAEMGELLFTVVALNFTAIGVMMKAGEFTNDIVGA